MKNPFIIYLLICFNAFLLSHSINSESKEQIHGIKTYFASKDLREKYNPDFKQFVIDIKQNKINTVFTAIYEGEKAFYKSTILKKSDTSYNLLNLRNLLKKNKIKFGAVCQIFFDPDEAVKNKDIVPVDQNGNNYYVNWQKLVCPSDEKYRNYKLALLEEIAKKFHPDFLSLDFIRYPVVWELINFEQPKEPANKNLDELKKVAAALKNAKLKGYESIKQELENTEKQNKLSVNDTLRQFCFCDRCIKLFSEKYKVALPAELKYTKEKSAYLLSEKKKEWQNWRAEIISSFVKEAVKRIKRIDKNIKICIHLVPWDEEILDNGLYSIAAQDINVLKRYTDYFSPMIYNNLIGLPNDYIKNFTLHLSNKTGIKILPSIQAFKIANEPEISSDDFSTILTNSLTAPSEGVLIFSWDKLFGIENENRLRKEKRNLMMEYFAK